jgi:hypothetical protein
MAQPANTYKGENLGRRIVCLDQFSEFAKRIDQRFDDLPGTLEHRYRRA